VQAAAWYEVSCIVSVNIYSGLSDQRSAVTYLCTTTTTNACSTSHSGTYIDYSIETISDKYCSGAIPRRVYGMHGSYNVR
jgi:hypothetical protein